MCVRAEISVGVYVIKTYRDDHMTTRFRDKNVYLYKREREKNENKNKRTNRMVRIFSYYTRLFDVFATITANTQQPLVVVTARHVTTPQVPTVGTTKFSDKQ